MASASESDWYTILGVRPEASDDEIGRAFRSLARRYHPDVGGEPSPGRFSDVAQAWEVLGQPSSRADYDRRRRAPAGVSIPVRRWASRAGGAPKVDTSTTDEGVGEDAETEVSISFAESITGTLARVSLPRAAICEDCSGSGHRSPGPCTACGGAGRHRRQSGSISITTVCSFCAGTGARPRQPCAVCESRGWQYRSRELSVRVPPGVGEGTKLRLRSPSTGAPAGIARVTIRPDPWFSRDGHDLVLRLPVSVPEAVLGCHLTAVLPDGPVEIAVPPGAANGDRLRVTGRGVPGSERGDLLLVVEVVMPDPANADQRAALEALAASTGDPRAGWPATTDRGETGPVGPKAC
ncbi:MAG TPA: J domain-containing protein [Acidimicrobiales bacterium]|nr:J domain-containing protein [Acidimicrobiales bacterium]